LKVVGHQALHAPGRTPDPFDPEPDVSEYANRKGGISRWL
jgi:hypothetical protein